MLTNIDNKLRKAFSATADQYDVLASLHREIGRELVAKIAKSTDATALLDIGCGTGYVSHKLKHFYPDARVVGIDFAPGMIAKAREKYEEGIEFIEADAMHLPFGNTIFDIVVSNLALQWAGELPKALNAIKRVLKPQGKFLATMFGYYTCDELLTLLPNKDFKRLPSKEEVETTLKQVFGQGSVDYERIKVQFNDVWELLQWLKGIGANHLSSKYFLGKQQIQKLNESYRQHFPYHHGIATTFEIIWIVYEAK